jgi:hypothetical protein
VGRLRSWLAVVWMSVSASALASSPTLCRLGFNEVCEPAPLETRLSQTQKEFFRAWASRYASLSPDGEAVVLAVSDLPQAIRHALFLDGGRVLARSQVRARLEKLGCSPDRHPVWRALLAAMPRAFGGEWNFYAGLELAIHKLLASPPADLAALRKWVSAQIEISRLMAAAKTKDTPQSLELVRREKAQAD